MKPLSHFPNCSVSQQAVFLQKQIKHFQVVSENGYSFDLFFCLFVFLIAYIWSDPKPASGLRWHTAETLQQMLALSFTFNSTKCLTTFGTLIT